MAKRVDMFYMVTMFVMIALFQGLAAQTPHTVGDSTGWRIPSGGATTYKTWASQQTFSVGDVLVFSFAPGSHDVTEVTKEAFDVCMTSDPISTTNTAPASITLSTVGEHYFICSFSGHCDAGQKLSVDVSSASTDTPPTSTASTSPPSTTVATSPPPPPSSAPSLTAMMLPVALFSIILASLY